MQPVFANLDESKLEWCDGFGAWHTSPVMAKFFDNDEEFIVVKTSDGSFRVINFCTGDTRS